MLVSDEKWAKGRAHVEEIQDRLEELEKCEKEIGEAQGLDRKRLEVIQGFLLYLFRTYVGMKPFMKGIHLTIDGWGADRDKAGWKVKGKKRKEGGMGANLPRRSDEMLVWSVELGGFVVEKLNAPARVSPADRLGSDVEAMSKLFRRPKPPKILVRSLKVIELFYGFADASGSGFGASFERGIRGDGALFYRFGQWCQKDSEESSNFRELRNLLDSLRAFLLDGSKDGSEIFLFTDNSTAEGAFWKGNSTSQALFAIICDLKELELDHSIKLHVIHVSGKQMI